jgi:hypothetical protein
MQKTTTKKKPDQIESEGEFKAMQEISFWHTANVQTRGK